MPVAVTHGRKTLPVAMVNLLAKQGVTVDSMEAVQWMLRWSA